MDTTIVIIIAAALIVAAIIGAVVLTNARSKRRTTHLRDQFGPEYDNTLMDAGGRKRGEAELASREKRVAKLDIRPLSDTQRQEYCESWRTVQSRFVDDPAGALADSDTLVNTVMTARGYPMGEWEKRAADISVDHPQVVAHYRAAHATYAGDRPTTEEMRQALISYRALFDELLTPETVGATR